MARISRQRNLYGLYHISQQSQADREIFQNEEQRTLFLQALQQALQQYRFQLLAYCLMEPDQYHLIVSLEGCDISKLMSSLNISYTRAISSSAGLFRERYKSRLLRTPAEVEEVLSAIRQCSTRGDKWNSFCSLDHLQGLTQALNVPQITPELVKSLYTEDVLQSVLPCSSRNGPCLTSPEALRIYLKKLAAAEGLSLEEALADKDLRNNWICQARRESTLSLRQIGEVFGGLSESMVSKVIKQHTQQGVTHA